MAKLSKLSNEQLENNKSRLAVINTGGKQYVVKEGQVIIIEKLANDMKISGKVTFDKVLLVDDGERTVLGAPLVSNAKVEGVLTAQGNGDKVVVIKYKAKSRYFKKRGHRQPFMKVVVSSIQQK